MPLLNFDTELDRAGVTRQVSVLERPSEPRASMARPSKSSSHLDKLDSDWGWEELRDYVVNRIEHFHGVQGVGPRDLPKEASIFKRFLSTYGEDAPAIARYAFEVCEGRWRGAPIGITRFTKGSDPWFAEPILERVRDAR